MELSNSDDISDDEKHNEDDFQTWTMKDSVIFLIDAGELMFQTTSEGEIPFQNSLKCAIATIQDKIVASHSDLVGVCLFGTKEKNNNHDIDHVTVFQELAKSDAKKIFSLETLLNSDDFKTQYGHCKEGEFIFADALWACANMFFDCKIKSGVKRIFIFTNNDCPNSGDSKFGPKSVDLMAKDLHGMGIDIELFSINKKGEQFDPNIFYSKIFSHPDEVELKDWKSAQTLADLHNQVRPQATKKRSTGKLVFTLFGSTQIGVSIFSLVNETKKRSPVPIDANTNIPLSRATRNITTNSKEIVEHDEIAYQYSFGGELVNFDKQQINEIRYPYKPGILLLCFKPQSSLGAYNVTHSYFLYPDEFVVEGSTLAFVALLDRMIDLKKIAIVRIVARENSPPKLAALLPQKEEFNEEDGSQKMPSGFHVIFLPFADDIRDVDIEKTPKANQIQIEKAKKVVSGVRIHFDSRNFENPALQKHYANLQDLALGRDIREEITDYVTPDVDGMMQFEDEIIEFKESVLPSYYAPDVKKTPGSKPPLNAKRKRENEDDDIDKDGNDGNIDKKRKIQSDIDWEIFATDSSKVPVTVADLKGYCVQNGIKNISTKNKNELIEMVKNHIKESQSNFIKNEKKTQDS